MTFRTEAQPPSPRAAPGFYLVADTWDDYGYQTSFDLYRVHGATDVQLIGRVKIGRLDADRPRFTEAGKQAQRTVLPEEPFTELDPPFVSLGQSPEYYAAVRSLPARQRQEVLEGLRDLAHDEARFGEVAENDVVRDSLLRTVSINTLEQQFRRILNGGKLKAQYRLTYLPPESRRSLERTVLELDAIPGALPPHYLHALVGSNGAGKSDLLSRIVAALCEDDRQAGEVGQRFAPDSGGSELGQVVGVVAISFSAFHPFEGPLPKAALSERPDAAPHRPATRPWLVRRPDHLNFRREQQSFLDDFAACRRTDRYPRWQGALHEVLGATPAYDWSRDDASQWKGRDLHERFEQLSSGHQIVLATLTALVAHLTEGVLVLIDEPELHLHPPLLSAFIRALSGLLEETNALALLATHSPVVLQELPRTCVTVLERTGTVQTFRRPAMETFGEAVGVLTQEVFGLEYERSGYHAFLRQQVLENPGSSARELAERLSLGSEARALLNVLLYERDRTSHGDQPYERDHPYQRDHPHG